MAHEGGHVGEERGDEENEDGSHVVVEEEEAEEEVHVARTRKVKEAALGMSEEDKTCLVWRTEVGHCGVRDEVCEVGGVICSISLETAHEHLGWVELSVTMSPAVGVSPSKNQRCDSWAVPSFPVIQPASMEQLVCRCPKVLSRSRSLRLDWIAELRVMLPGYQTGHQQQAQFVVGFQRLPGLGFLRHCT